MHVEQYIYTHRDYKQLTVIYTAVKNVQYRVDFEVLERLDLLVYFTN